MTGFLLHEFLKRAFLVDFAFHLCIRASVGNLVNVQEQDDGGNLQTLQEQDHGGVGGLGAGAGLSLSFQSQLPFFQRCTSSSGRSIGELLSSSSGLRRNVQPGSVRRAEAGCELAVGLQDETPRLAHAGRFSHRSCPVSQPTRLLTTRERDAGEAARRVFTEGPDSLP
jgi:hypothetical protein